MVRAALLTAIIVLMAFTPLGYFKTGGLSITLLPIPVVIGAITVGPSVGALLGFVFAITSVVQCFGLEPFGTTLMGINPVGTILTCIVPRVLMGFLAGIIFKIVKRFSKGGNVPFVVASLSGAILNTAVFMSLLCLFFYNTEFIQGLVSAMGAGGMFTFVLLFVGVNGVIEAVACCILGGLISKAICAFSNRSKKVN